MAHCPLCGGHGETLGALGRLIWYRCQDCGGQWSKRARPRWPQWQRVNGAFSARYFANGRTDVRRESTGEIVRSRSPSLQDDMRRGAYHSALFYLFGRDAESEIDAAA